MNLSHYKIAAALTVSACLLSLPSLSNAAKYQALAGGVTNGGTLSGRVVFDGTPPPPKKLEVDTDAAKCGQQYSEDLLVSKSSGIKNVVLSINDIKEGKAWDFPKSFEFDQKGCKFVPHVMLVEPKTPGEIKNSDMVGHNVHTISRGIFSVNKKMKANSDMEVKKGKLRKPGVVRVKCDLHSWMHGYWYIAKTPYTVLTDADGNYSISNIPPGTYTLTVWHETLGKSKQKVTITAGGTTKLDIHLKLPN